MIKKFILMLVFGLLMTTAVFGESVPVLLYHNITEQAIQPGQALLHTSKDDFAAHMKGLKEAGYHTVTLDDYYDFVKNGKTLPDKPVIITFDDGYETNYQYAYPVLKELGMKATIFMITGHTPDLVNAEYPHFSWEQAKEMADSGVITIGSHTHRHKDIPTLSYGGMVYELRQSKYLIETKLGQKSVHLAFPYGSFSDEAVRVAVSSGYKTICFVGDQGVNSKNGNIYGLKRLTAKGDMTAEDVIEMMEREKREEVEEIETEPEMMGSIERYMQQSYDVFGLKGNGIFAFQQ